MKHLFYFAIVMTMLLTNGLVIAQDTTMTITNNGNVGIGTTDPNAMLEIVRDGTGNHPFIVRNSGSYPHHIGIFYGQDDSKGWWLRTESDGNFHIGAENLISNNGRIVIQDNTGNVGIGTTNPTYKLDVNGNVSATEFWGDGSHLINLPSTSQWITNGNNIYYNLGYVGIGTSNPNTKLHVLSETIGGNAARFDGAAYIQTHNQVGMEPALRFIKSSTGDDTQWGLGQAGSNNNLHLRYKPSGSAWGGDFLTINTDGNVGIGTTNPGAKLEIVRDGTGDAPFIVRNSGSFQNHIGIFYGQDESKGWWLRTTSDGNFHIGAENMISNDGRMVIQDNTGNVGIGTTNPGYTLDVAGSVHGTSFPTSSDIRFKKNVKPITNALEKVKQLEGVYFEWNDLHKEVLGRSKGMDGTQVGFIAQEVEKVVPEVISKWGQDNVNDYLAIDYARLTAILVEAVKEQQKEIDELKTLLTKINSTNSKNMTELR